MKKVFDELRKNIKEAMVEMIVPMNPLTERCYGKKIAFLKSLAIIDEAEAKWEEDCCEWKKIHSWFYPKCRNLTEHSDNSVNEDCESYTFCPYCGKRIKISEVE